jgi:hypothetical protein
VELPALPHKVKGKRSTAPTEERSRKTLAGNPSVTAGSRRWRLDGPKEKRRPEGRRYETIFAGKVGWCECVLWLRENGASQDAAKMARHAG